MNIEFKSSFVKDLKHVKDKRVLARAQAAIVAMEQATNLQEIPNCKKLQGSNNYYRIRIGDFRIGLSVTDGTVKFVRLLHRGDIYKYFP